MASWSPMKEPSPGSVVTRVSHFMIHRLDSITTVNSKFYIFSEYQFGFEIDQHDSELVGSSVRVASRSKPLDVPIRFRTSLLNDASRRLSSDKWLAYIQDANRNLFIIGGPWIPREKILQFVCPSKPNHVPILADVMLDSGKYRQDDLHWTETSLPDCVPLPRRNDHRLKKLLATRGSRVTLEVQGLKWSCSKLAIATSSSVWAALLRYDEMDDRLTLKTVEASHDIMDSIVRVIHHQKMNCKFDLDSSVQLLQLADLFQMNLLRAVSVKNLAKLLKTFTEEDIADLAELFNVYDIYLPLLEWLSTPEDKICLRCKSPTSLVTSLSSSYHPTNRESYSLDYPDYVIRKAQREFERGKNLWCEPASPEQFPDVKLLVSVINT